jgi:thioredoxin reductase
MYDLIIIGGSAAGTSAAIYAARAKLNFKLLAMDLGGEVANSGGVDNYLGFNDTTGVRLSQKFNSQLEHNQVDFEVGYEAQKVTQIESGYKIIGLNANRQMVEYKSRTVIVATGVRPRHLNVPGEPELYQKGLSYCTTCDGPLFKNKVVITIGGGNSALESILMMKNLATKVISINKNPEFKGERVYIDKVTSADNVELIHNAVTTRILGDQRVTAIEYTDKDSGEPRQIETDAVFVHIGITPNTEMVKELGVLDSAGFVIANQLMATELPGLFAAGDVVNLPYNQIIIAAGQGATASLAVQTYLHRLA